MSSILDNISTVSPLKGSDVDLAKKRWLNYYKGIIEWDLLKKDKNEFMRRMRIVNMVTANIDYESNILFRCNVNCASFVFLSGLSRPRDYIRTVYYGNALDMLHTSLYMGEVANDFMQEEFNSKMSKDLMCGVIQREAALNKYGQMISLLISSRASERNSHGENKISWIFYHGFGDGEETETMKVINSTFRANAEMKYSSFGKWQIIDLNPYLGMGTEFERGMNPEYKRQVITYERPENSLDCLKKDELVANLSRQGDIGDFNIDLDSQPSIQISRPIIGDGSVDDMY